MSNKALFLLVAILLIGFLMIVSFGIGESDSADHSIQTTQISDDESHHIYTKDWEPEKIDVGLQPHAKIKP